MTSAHLTELGSFLKARRDELSPDAFDLPDDGRVRRVAGLRREEVAKQAAISTDYYTRLEQGRIPPSESVLAALAPVLRLSDDQRDYLFELAGKEQARPRHQARQRAQPQLRLLLGDLASIPGVVLGRRMDVLAWNPLAAALITDFAAVPAGRRNYVRLLFTDPAMRSLYQRWEAVARQAVAQLRRNAARYPDDPRLAALVGELSVQDRHFRQWWGAHYVAAHSVGTKTLRHPVAGELTLESNMLTCSTDPDQHLVIWTAKPGTPSDDGLRILASSTATRPRTRSLT
ncbi:helix-turn-helix transcriptional regulator [Saccharomonospora sp. NPDC046836]|uniref:helix-turn-helix domain-containing protein n=1 Tax=Saccharomonospora sp. NPDC046836 TaxID=3156921 RepID=UPI0033D51EA8